MVKLYERGCDYSRVDEETGEPRAIAIPKAIALACFALYKHGPTGITPMGPLVRMEEPGGKRRR